jgi:hypothetical protein
MYCHGIFQINPILTYALVGLKPGPPKKGFNYLFELFAYLLVSLAYFQNLFNTYLQPYKYFYTI